MVKVYNGNSGSILMWQGFVNTGVYYESYSTTASLPSSIISINCNDGMNVLDSLYYKETNGDLYTDVSTFGSVLKNIFNKLGTQYNYIHTSNDLTLFDTSSNLFTKMKVDNENFFDENLVPMSCREVLDSFLGGLGLVMFFKGSDIFIIDPISLHDVNKGMVYDVSTFTEDSSSMHG